MLRDPLLLCALLILGFALNNSRPARAQVISLKEALNLSKPPADHRIPYGDDRNQFGDLRLPRDDGPFPVVIVIHGGCYQARPDLTLLSSFCADLTAAGVATWDLEYRLFGNEGGGWPGTVEDIAPWIGPSPSGRAKLPDRFDSRGRRWSLGGGALCRVVGRTLASPERPRSLFGRPNPASRRRAACGGNGLAQGPQG